MGNSQSKRLKTAVKAERWGKVKSLLTESNYSSSAVEQFITACEQYDVIYVDGDILTYFNTDQRNRLLKIAVKEERWEEVNSLLSHSKYSSSVVEQFITACEQYDVFYVDGDILTYFNTDQRNRLLSGRNYSSSVVEQFITACEQYGVVCVDGELLSHCNTEQRTRLLKTAVKKKWWWTVRSFLQHSNDSNSVVEQFITACEQYDVFYVDEELLTQSTTQQLDRLLTLATTKRQWLDVDKVLKAGGSHGKRVWVIAQMYNSGIDSRALDSYILLHNNDYFLSHCSTQQMDCLLTAATRNRHWDVVGRVLKAGGSHEKRVWVIEQALFRHSDIYSWGRDRYILPHINDDFLSRCSTQQLDCLLTAATTNGHWNVVDKVLKAGGSHEKRVRVIDQACKTADDCDFERYILPNCYDDQLESVLTHLVTRTLWESVGKVLERGVSDTRHRWAVEEASKTADDSDFKRYILPYCSDDQLESVLTHLVTRGLWKSVGKVLERGVSDTQHRWAVEEASKTADDSDFERYILPYYKDDQLESVLTHLVTRGLWKSVGKVLERGVSDKSRTWALYEGCKDLTAKYTYTTVMSSIGKNLEIRNSDVKRLLNSVPSKQLSREVQNVALRFALQQRNWDVISRASLSQVWEQVRRHLFREAVYQKRWKIVKKWADHTLYDDQRWWALEEAYKHKQWDVMLQLADHGLTEIELMRVRYRLAKHADWDVVVRMIERGVDVTEVREVVESTMISRKTKTTKDRATQEAFKLRWWQLRQLEKKLTRDSATSLKLPSTARQWDTVLFHLHRHPRTASVPSRSQPSKTFGGLLLQRAIQQRLWHVVMHLVRLGIGTDQLDSLLTDMMRRRQWGVCRVLLEQGVSVQSCLRALSVFMKMNQWMLVARVMEFIVDDALKRHVEQLALVRNVGSLVWQCVSTMCRYGMCVGDAVRLQVMQRAMERREGSVVGECISTMHHYHLSVKEREELFQQAISRGVLQAVKPLVEEKNDIETQHRDATMLAAIEQRQWDVVDCCQLQGTDIDMKDWCGETPLNREVRETDMKTVEWKAVEELVVRGADPNVLDKYRCSVLNRAIHAKQWDMACLLIEYHADIHMRSHYAISGSRVRTPNPITPLKFLIYERQGDILHHTLIWCPDQAKGVNKKGETTLHAIALDKKPELMYYQIVRGVNPLTVTKLGHSVLFYAVQNEHCPQRMVGECIRLGFSTHQPQLTREITVAIAEVVTRASLYEITSPFLLAVVRGMHVVAHMLYESGSCSYSELLHLYTKLLDISDPHTEDGRKLWEGEYLHAGDRFLRFAQYRQRYDAFMNTLTTFLPYLREMASTPRSLVSTCRLVISHCLTVRRRRERAVQDLTLTDGKKGIKYVLPLPERMKEYLLFSDLTDPDYQWFLYGTLPPLKVKKKKQNSKAVRRQRQRGARRT